MKQLPEVARSLIEDAREAHGPNGAHGPSEAQMQNMLASLHAKLGYTAAADPPPPAADAAGSSAHHAHGPLQAKAASDVAGHAQGLLHAKLLKLVLSLAAVGGMVALVAPRIWSSEPSRTRASIAAQASTVVSAANVSTKVDTAESVARAVPAAAVSGDDAARALEAARGGADDAQRASEDAARVSPVAAQGALRRGSAEPQSGRSSSLRQGAGGPLVPSAREPSSGIGATAQAEQQPLAARVRSTGAALAAKGGAAQATERASLAEGALVAKAGGAQAERVQLTDVVPIQSARSRQQQRAARSGATDADELALIERAASRLRDGDHEEALELLQEHGRRFPSSQLQLERRGLSVLARCGAGQLEQGRRERATFLRDAGQTPLATRVRRACIEGQP